MPVESIGLLGVATKVPACTTPETGELLTVNACVTPLILSDPTKGVERVNAVGDINPA